MYKILACFGNKQQQQKGQKAELEGRREGDERQRRFSQDEQGSSGNIEKPSEGLVARGHTSHHSLQSSFWLLEGLVIAKASLPRELAQTSIVVISEERQTFE